LVKNIFPKVCKKNVNLIFYVKIILKIKGKFMKKFLSLSLTAIIGATSLFSFDHLTTVEEFEKSIKKGSYIVDFYASWCGPCQEMEKNLKKLPVNKQGIKIYKVNIEKSPKLVAKYGTPQIPALLYIQDGKILDGYIGLKQMPELKQDIKRYFGNSKG
jgi:thioredoxin 1